MEKTETGLAAAVLLGLTIVFGGIFICACLMSGARIPSESGRAAVYACLSGGCLFASFVGARKAASKKLIFGLCPVLCILGCLFLLAFCWRGQPIRPASAAAVSGICLLSAVLGAVPGAVLRTKKRK